MPVHHHREVKWMPEFSLSTLTGESSSIPSKRVIVFMMYLDLSCIRDTASIGSDSSLCRVATPRHSDERDRSS